MLGRHVVHLGDEALEIAAQRLDGVVDEGLLAGKLFQRRLEIAFAELLDAGHRLLLDDDMARYEIVDPGCHDLEVALEGINGYDDVNITLGVLVGHAVHGGSKIVNRALGCVEQSIDRFQYVFCVTGDVIEIGTTGNVAGADPLGQIRDLRERGFGPGGFFQLRIKGHDIPSGGSSKTGFHRLEMSIIFQRAGRARPAGLAHLTGATMTVSHKLSVKWEILFYLLWR